MEHDKVNIIDLSAIRKPTKKFFEKVSNIVDYETGEVKTSSTSIVKQVSSRDDFVKLFVNNLDIFLKLDVYETRLLTQAFKNLTYKNTFMIDSNFINYIVTVSKAMGKTSFYKSKKNLIKKKILIPIDSDDLKNEFEVYGNDWYFINPDITGKGSFNDLRKLKRTIVQYYDFETLSYNQEVHTESAYQDFDELIENKDKFEVKEIRHNIDKDGLSESKEIIVGKKNYIDAEELEKQEVIEEPNLFDDNNIYKKEQQQKKDSMRDDWLMFEEERIREEIIEQEREKFEKLDLNGLKFALATKEYEIKKFKIENKNLDKELFEFKEAKLQMQKSEIEYKISLEMKKEQ